MVVVQGIGGNSMLLLGWLDNGAWRVEMRLGGDWGEGGSCAGNK